MDERTSQQEEGPDTQHTERECITAATDTSASDDYHGDESEEERTEIEAQGEEEQEVEEQLSSSPAKHTNIQHRKQYALVNGSVSPKLLSAVAVSSTPLAPSPSPPRFGLVGVWAALILAQLLWSIFYVLTSLVFPYVPPYVLPSLRALICVPSFFALGYFSLSPTFYLISLSDLLWIGAAGVFGNFLNQQCLNVGLSLTSAADAGMIQPAIPVFTTILALVRKQEQLSLAKGIGIGVSSAGSVIMVLAEELYPSSSNDSDSNPASRPIGILLILTQTFCWSVYLIIQRPLLSGRGIPLFTFTFWMFTCGGVCHWLFGLYWDIVVVQWMNIPWQVWLSVLYIGLGATVLAFWLFVYAAKHLPASIMAVSTVFSAIFSPALGVIFLQETLSSLHFVGGVFIIAGVVLVIYTRSREVKQEQQAPAVPDSSTINFSHVVLKNEEEQQDQPVDSGESRLDSVISTDETMEEEDEEDQQQENGEREDDEEEEIDIDKDEQPDIESAENSVTAEQ